MHSLSILVFVIIILFEFKGIYKQYTKKLIFKKADSFLSKVHGYEDYKWGMSLEEAMEITTCKYPYLQRSANWTWPHEDFLTFYCDESVLSKSPIIGVMEFKSNSLMKISLIYILNEKAIKLYQETHSLNLNQKNLEHLKNPLPERPEDSSSYFISDYKNFSQIIQSTLIKDKSFDDIYDRLTDAFGLPTYISDITQKDFEKKLNKEGSSPFIFWGVNSAYTSISAEFKTTEQNEKSVILNFTAPQE